MNGCNEVQTKLTEYMDGRLSGREMQLIAAHLENCRGCAGERTSIEQMQSSLSALGPVPAPEDMLLRIRVAISQERARSRQGRFHAFNLAWRNTVGPFLLQAAAGFASAVLLMGTVIVLVSMFAQPESAQATADEPLGMATAPRFLYLSSVVGGNQIDAISGPVVIEAYVNGQGQVYDYRIVSGPTDEVTRAQVENLLLWSRFEPARRFGQPVPGLAVLSFSGVSVRG
ncbi:MAG: zf-HC2 domain-containing protein [Terracidiphilus sp.]|jgi:negative regulator of sigma E activity